MKLRAHAAFALTLLFLLGGCTAPGSREVTHSPGTAVITAPAPVVSVSGKTVVCLRVVDGDTVVVLIDGAQEHVRLLCVNTPERGKPGYAEARGFLRSKIEGHEIRLESDSTMKDRDRFGRLLRYVWLGNELVNASIIEAKHSSYWVKYGRSSLHDAALARAVVGGAERIDQ